MIKVTSIHLSEDLKSANSELGLIDHGQVSPETLKALLETFRHLDPVLNQEHDPHLLIQGASGRVKVKTNAAKLYLFDESGSTELSVDEILRIVRSQAPSFEEAGADDLELQPQRKVLNQSIALSMLIVGLILNGYTLYSAFYVDDVNLSPPLVLVTDPREYEKLRDQLAGSFLTGFEAGDRGIHLTAEGTLRLTLQGSKGVITRETRHSYNLGRRDNKLFVGLKPRGQIEVLNRDTLLFYGDTYRRLP